jgi:hypothetical protein
MYVYIRVLLHVCVCAYASSLGKRYADKAEVCIRMCVLDTCV